MRAILIDWLVQVNLKFRLLQETMYMTVGIIDRFLQVGDFVNLLGHLSQKCQLFNKPATPDSKWCIVPLSGPPSPQEAAAAGWCDRHVPCFQIRGDVSPWDLRLCLCHGQGLHHRPDPRHGDDHPPSTEVPTRTPSSPAVPPTGLKDLRGL